jgi:hypothetical protein
MDIGRVEAVSHKLEQLARIAMSIQSRYGAHFALHSAAVLDKDRDAVLEHRQALHSILDRLLDNGEAIQRATDELIELSRMI